VAPQLGLDLRLLPSGVVFLSVYPGARAFALEYHPTQGTGVSEITPETTPFDMGHDHVFDAPDAAADCLLGLVRTVTESQSNAA
jgi:hypothetical protein